MINEQWYLIKSDWIDHLESGDYLIKHKDSYFIQINKSGGYKYRIEEKSVIFEKADRLPAKQKY